MQDKRGENEQRWELKCENKGGQEKKRAKEQRA